ncbi:YitT family protein [Bacteroidales bacterium OttesenSCG-928-K03]|nr:YitT family protein [Bacteroidales bacterium OttesenSCG-928-L14]MDL2240032.1 YitT family protein [Bacteroidales bacterium OttesenSCG-928-K22]MDL2242256.1 YitT family protein [Bacteroidales bacterium OttesenSCG-928-K03]
MTSVKRKQTTIYQSDKPFSKNWIKSYLFLIVGTAILAFGYSCFMTPYKITPGGIYGISIVLHYKFGFPVGMAALCFNLPLTLLGLRLLGPRFGIKTFLGFCLTALFTDGITWLFGDDPLQLGDDIILASLFGGVVLGIGVGFIFKAKASSGGSDVIASILAKYTKIPLGQQLMIVDSCIVVLGFLAFQDWKVPLYSWTTIFIMGKVIDVVMKGFSDEKTVYIISDKYEEIRTFIINDLDKSGTVFNAKGLYTEQEKNVIFAVMNRRLLPYLQEGVFKIDPQAFVTILDAYEIIGNGFKRFSAEN